MCGDLDEDHELEQKLYARFQHHAQALLAQYGASEGAGEAPADLNQYLDELFADALRRSADDAAAAEPAKRYERLSMQPLVFARLAGFLAAHLSLSEDPLRKVIEALMMGYAEAEGLDRVPDPAHQHGDVPVGGR
jgi:hypothetical protein